MEDDDVEGGPVPAGLDGRRSGVSRGCPQDGRSRPAPGHGIVEQAPQQLQGVVLESKGRTPEQLQQPGTALEFGEGDQPVEAGVGGPGQLIQRRDRLPHERRRHPGHDLGIGEVPELLDLGTLQVGPGLRDVEPPVGSQAGQHDLFEPPVRRTAPGGHVPHRVTARRSAP